MILTVELHRSQFDVRQRRTPSYPTVRSLVLSCDWRDSLDTEGRISIFPLIFLYFFVLFLCTCEWLTEKTPKNNLGLPGEQGGGRRNATHCSCTRMVLGQKTLPQDGQRVVWEVHDDTT